MRKRISDGRRGKQTGKGLIAGGCRMIEGKWATEALIHSLDETKQWKQSLLVVLYDGGSLVGQPESMRVRSEHVPISSSKLKYICLLNNTNTYGEGKYREETNISRVKQFKPCEA
ncbi:hypothetical protein EVAR_7601_1 [Eumeta japonica]|uniref:Uncharacterized protein n=1 Tax=Eumeta variegata TaxID=151549 RepID=A0A4C1TJ62_EUMVA|nr:hypothetical protein EVAR_7601_1 [Eumeta japonica]